MNRAVLLVEDNDADAGLVARAAKKTVIAAPLLRVANAETAIDYLEGKPPYDDRLNFPMPSVILLDLKLPGLSGFEMLAWLRRQPAPLSQIVVVMLTSSSQQVDVNRCYELGANSYLRKPDQHAELIALLRTFNEYWLVRCGLPEVARSKPAAG